MTQDAWRRRFARYVMARGVATGGSNLASVVLAFAVVAVGGDAVWVGIVLACAIGSQAALLPVGGVVADRCPRCAVVVSCYLVKASAHGVVGGWLVLAPDAVTPWHFVVAALVEGVTSAAGQPAVQGLMVDLVPTEHRQSANASLRLVLNVARVALPGLGTTLALVLGYGPVLLAVGTALLVAAVVMSGVRVPASRPLPRQNPWRDAREGWAVFTARTWLWVYVAQGALVVPLWLAGYQLLGPLVMAGRPGGVAWWGWAFSAFATGMILGSVVGLRWRPRRLVRASVLAQLVWPVPLVVVAAGVPVVWLLVAMLVSGLGLDLSTVLWETAKQQHVPGVFIGRISSLQMLGELLLVPGGYLLAGVVAARTGAEPLMACCYVLITLLTAALLLVPSIRHLSRVEPVVEGGSGKGLQAAVVRRIIGGWTRPTVRGRPPSGRRAPRPGPLR